MAKIKPSRLVAKLKRREEESTADLLAKLKAAQRDIAAKVEKAAEKRSIATDAGTREDVYRKVGGVYEELNEGIDSWMRELSDRTAQEWHGEALAEIRAKDQKPGVVKFDRKRAERYWQIINPDNSKHLAAVFTEKLETTDKKALRSAFVDTFRQQAIEGLTAKETHKELQAKWDATAKNLRGDRFIDAAGRPWTNADYLGMLVRTTLQRVSSEAFTDTLVENGFDLARISDDGDPCHLCLPWRGVIVSITGSTKGFPTLATARDAGWQHPNCMCRLEYLDEDLDAEEAKRQKGTPTPKMPKEAFEDKEKMAQFRQEMDEYNREISIRRKMDAGLTKPEAENALKRDLLALKLKGAFPDKPEMQNMVDDIPPAMIDRIDFDAIPNIEPAKRGDPINDARNSSAGGVLYISGKDPNLKQALDLLQAKQPAPAPAPKPEPKPEPKPAPKPEPKPVKKQEPKKQLTDEFGELPETVFYKKGEIGFKIGEDDKNIMNDSAINADEWAAANITPKWNPDKKEKDTLERYQGSEHEDINGYLTDKLKPEYAGRTDPYLEKKVENIRSALDKTDLKVGVISHRGTQARELGIPIEDLEISVGQKVDLPRFLSTSINDNVAHNFASRAKGNHWKDRPLMMKIHVPKGTKAGYLNPVNPDGPVDEMELLIKNGYKAIIKGFNPKNRFGYPEVEIEIIP